jgi:hypothetical protein
MAATIEILLPDMLVKALGASPSELPRRTLETLAAEAYRVGKLSHAQVGEILDLDRWQTDAFLKERQAYRASETEEFASDLANLRSLD